ncbi:hypothetical protein A3K73_05830 [Candidatus Pacearchaeota archaeon RBG_13_36_9]|nr:MAG: hypothetical protein A3K73_05830 [Candidatus Pacearchaeota archaeon RBG_13_36_9]
MDKKELEFILKEGEGYNLEFKEGRTGIDKDIIAFANSEGGRIFIGINDEGKVLGVPIGNRLKSEIQTISRNCDPSIKIELEQFENILIINVEEGKDKPYKCKDGFFIRIGANSQKMSRDEILDLILTANKKTFDSLINESFSLKEDFDNEKLSNYLEKANLSNSIPTEKILKELGVLDKSLNNAGILFFSKEPQKFFPQSIYTAAVFRDAEGADVIERKEIGGSLVEIIEKVMAFVEFYVKVAYRFTGKPQRENIYEYPREAIREAVINSVMHKDYFETGHNNIIKIFPDKIQIENIWKRPKHFKLGETVFRRNPIIANLFSRIHFGEKIGSGFARIKEYCKKENAPYPKIKFTDSHFYVTFKPNPEYTKMASPQITPQITPQKIITELEQKILNLIIKNPRISRKQISTSLDIGEDTVKEYLERLKQKGILRRIGPDKGGYWEILE